MTPFLIFGLVLFCCGGMCLVGWGLHEFNPINEIMEEVTGVVELPKESASYSTRSRSGIEQPGSSRGS
jgi:hypothetical protein